MYNLTIDGVFRHNIITTCGDKNVKYSTQKVDPALCLDVGTFLICVLSNKFLKEAVPRDNGTLCPLVSKKLENNATSHK